MSLPRRMRFMGMMHMRSWSLRIYRRLLLLRRLWPQFLFLVLLSLQRSLPSPFLLPRQTLVF